MDRSALRDGVVDAAPAVPPGVPLGMVFGATAVEVGIDPLAATAMSVFTFAGAAQVAAVELLRSDADLSVALLTVLLLNLRYVVYSASLVRKVEDMSRRWRAVMAYALFDVNFALAINRFRRGDGMGANEAGDTGITGDARGWYYVGATVPLVGSFAAATLAGALAGTTVGTGLDLGFAIPLVFTALLVPRLESNAALVAAGVAAVVVVAGVGLPFNAGLLVAAAVGTVAGVLTKRYGDDDTDGADDADDGNGAGDADDETGGDPS
jgi:predicted branched-subunit amino acid permease